MFYTIYKTTNKINGKIYIGKHVTADLDDGYLGSGKHLNRAIKKHGIENFVKEILQIFDNEVDMNAREAELVTEEFVLQETNYNLCTGGQGGFSYINKNKLQASELAKKKRKDTMIEAYGMTSFSQITSVKAKISGARKKEYASGRISAFADKRNNFSGRTHTDEWKKRHSEVMKDKCTGANNSQYGTIWITDGASNKKIKAHEQIPSGWTRGRK